MKDARKKRAKLNIVISLAGQMVTLLCGFIVPGLLIRAYGSEAYGATTSIAQLLAYITLLEGGIGGVARAVLYKPLAENDMGTISAVVTEMRRFFRIIALIFLAYVLILACSFTNITDVDAFDWWTTFLLVIVISISTIAQYFIGITYQVLLQAAQKTYITNAVSTVATILNAMLTIILVGSGCSILIVKLVSSCVFVLRPIVLQAYVQRHFSLTIPKEQNRELLSQKWIGLGQHIAFFLHSNTDIMILTVLSDLKQVAVYSVYNMIVSHIQGFAVSFATGMEALFGDMIAKAEHKQLNETFNQYETMISIVVVILFSATAVLIMPFIKIYTAGITDADYFVPLFALLMTLSSVLYCLRLPYHAATIAAGHFRQTKVAAYGEVAINVFLSVVLVTKLGLVGVAVGTLTATAFRFLFYVVYLSRQIMHRPVALFAKRFVVNAVNFVAAIFLGEYILSCMTIEGYAAWAFCGVAVAGASAVLTVSINFVAYRNDMLLIVQSIKNR